ncbi:MAG: hypothetical protein VKJ02_15960 [Snowella sp.]|nr:hypothetical protein [Snowella sp.]
MLITYGVFGWHIAALSVHWSHILALQIHSWGILLQDEVVLLAIHGMAILMIAVTAVALTAPLNLMTFFIGTCIRSDGQSVVAMVIWTFIFVCMLRWFNISIHFVVLLCAAILGRLELRYLGLTQNKTVLMLMLLGTLGFGSGAVAYLTLFDPSLLKFFQL